MAGAARGSARHANPGQREGLAWLSSLLPGSTRLLLVLDASHGSSHSCHVRAWCVESTEGW